MVQQVTIEDTWDWCCLKCGLRHVGAVSVETMPKDSDTKWSKGA